MAWPNPFRMRDENTRTAWGYTFQLTAEHLTPNQTSPLKYSYDTLAEEALDRLNLISPPTAAALPRNSPRTSAHHGECQKGVDGTPPAPTPAPKRDLFILLRDNAAKDEKLSELWKQVNTVPDWVDWDQIARGQEVFYRYGGASLTGLAFQSLLGGMGASRVVETLARTGGFSTKVARHRLFETTQYILEVTRSIEDIKPGGAGFASSIRVRLLHAAVRQRIMKLTQQRPGYYNVEKWGIPINDLDCIATIGTFSATLFWLSLPRQGIWLRQQEILDCLSMWRYIAFLQGTPTDPFSSPQRARTVMESLLLYEIDPSETSKILANNIIKCLEGRAPSYASKAFLEANSRWLNGNELCDRLGLGRPGFYYWALVAGQCMFFMALCYTYRSVPYLDRRKIAALRKIFWAVIVENKHGLGETSIFDFKYIPEFNTITEMGNSEGTGLKQSGLERRNLKALLTGLGVLTVTGICGFKIVLGFVHKIALVRRGPRAYKCALKLYLNVTTEYAFTFYENYLLPYAHSTVAEAPKSFFVLLGISQMAFMTPHSRVDLANQRPGMRLTSTPSKLQGTKTPSRSYQQPLALSLRDVIGATTSSPNGFDCLWPTKTFALCAGSAVVLNTLGDDDRCTQRFFRARPTAAPASLSNLSITPTTPIRGPDHQSRKIGSAKDGGLGALCSGTPYQEPTDSPSQKTWTARERIKAATCVSLSPDGKFVAVGETGYNPRVLIFSAANDAPAETPLSIMSEHTFGVRCIAFSPDSNLLASVGHLNDGFLYIWTINSRSGSTKLFMSNKCTSYIRGIAWIGNNLITVGTRHVKVWRIDAPLPSPSKQRFAGDAMLPNTPASPAPKVLCGRNCLLGSLAEASFTCVASLSDDKAIICTDKGDVCLLDDSGRTQKLSRVTDVEFGIHCTAVDGEGDNATIWVGGEQGIVRAFALSDLSKPRTSADSPASDSKTSPVIHRHASSCIVALGCTRGRLVTIDSDHYIRAIVTSTQDSPSQQGSVVLELPAHGNAVMGVKSFSQENELQCQFYTWSAKGSVLLWDLHGKCRASLTVELDQQLEYGTTNELVVVRALSQGAYFVSGDKYGVLRVTRCMPQESTFDMKAHGAEITDICVVDRPESTTLVACCGRDRMVQLLRQRADRLELIQTFDDHVGSITQLLFLERGEKLLSCSSDRTIVIRQLYSREDAGAVVVAYVPVRTLVLKSTPVSMAQIPRETDNLVVSTLDKQIQEFDLLTGRSIQTFRASDQESTDSVVMDGLLLWGHPNASQVPTLLAGVASTDKSIRLYVYENLSLLTREHGHTEGVSGVALIEANSSHPDGNTKATLISTGMDGTIMIWDVAARSHAPFEGIVRTDPQSHSTPVKEPTAVKAPFRRILSKSELSEFFKSPNSEGSTPVALRAVNRSPPRLRKKTSRYALASQTPSMKAPASPSQRRSPTALLADSSELKRFHDRSITPPSPKPARSQRPSFGARARTKSAGNVSEFSSINLTTEQVCRALRAYRKKFSTSSQKVRAENARELKYELELTIQAVGGRTGKQQVASEAMAGDPLEQYLEKLDQIIDERVAVGVANLTKSDSRADVSREREEQSPAVDVVGEG